MSVTKNDDLDAVRKYSGHNGRSDKDMNLYTKNGRPLQVSGDYVYSRSGTLVGRIIGEKVHGADGQYVGTIVGDCLVYRSSESANVTSSFSGADRAGSAMADRVGSAIWGDEPDIPD